MLSRVLIVTLGFLWMAGCKSEERPEDSINMKQITLPGGRQIMAEVMSRPTDMMKGMMFRTSLPEDRGLLFVHVKPAKYSYWMHNVKVPLDIIWMDTEHKIVEISANTPPCLEQDAVKCPQFGGNAPSQFVLELAAGMAAKYGLAEGQILSF